MENILNDSQLAELRTLTNVKIVDNLAPSGAKRSYVLSSLTKEVQSFLEANEYQVACAYLGDNNELQVSIISVYEQR